MIEYIFPNKPNSCTHESRYDGEVLRTDANGKQRMIPYQLNRILSGITVKCAGCGTPISELPRKERLHFV